MPNSPKEISPQQIEFISQFEIISTENSNCEHLELKDFEIDLKETQNREKTKKSSALKEVLLDWSIRVDINAYNKIWDYNNILVKLIWSFIFASSTGLTLLVCVQSVMQYLEYEVITKTNMIYQRPTKFPAVTLCDNDQFTTRDAELFLKEIAAKNNLSFTNKNDLEKIIILGQMKAANPSYSDDMRKKLGLSRNQIECSFNGSPTNAADCKNDLHWFYSYEFGNCFQFNTGLDAINNKAEWKYVLGEGEKYGLTLTIFPLTNSFLTINKNGMILFIHNNSFTPRISDSVKIRTGEWSYISVKKTFSRKHPKPYSLCDDSSIGFKTDFYRQEDCLSIFIQKKIIENCGCYYLRFENLNQDIKPCLSLSQNDCLESQIEKLNINDCETCPLECETTTYDLTVSSLVNPSIYAYENLRKDEIEFYKNLSSIQNSSLSYEAYKSLFVNVTIYFKSLFITEISEMPKTSLIEMFGQMGGSLQLFVSYSIFTFFELIEGVILLIFALFKK
jgi:hypothetical protein